jgi:putative ABC transport system permease protein
MLHKRFVARVIWQSRRQAAIFVLCTVLSLVTLVALSGFAESVRRAMMDDARRLQAADVLVHASMPFSDGLQREIARLTETGAVEAARIYEFYSLVRVPQTGDTLLSQVKVVPPPYPFYGEVVLASGQPLDRVLGPGRTVVEPAVLERLGLRVGDDLRLGQARLTIADTLLNEPDRPVDFFALGPRVMVAAADLEALELVRHGSRVRHSYRIRLPAPEMEASVVQRLQQAAVAGQEFVEPARSADSRITRFFDNLLFFLGLVGIFTLLLAGVGIQSALAALLRDQTPTIAILRTVGATHRFIAVHYLAAVLLMAVVGTVGGLTGGMLLQLLLPILFAGLIPQGLGAAPTLSALMEGAVLGIVVVGLFAFLPLYRLREVRPAATLSISETAARRGPAYLGAVAAVGVFFAAMILWQIEDGRIGGWFVAGTGLLIGFLALCTRLILAGVRRLPARHMVLRQAVRGLFRPRNATAATIVTLAAALTVILTIMLVERNLDATFIQSYPDDAPNLFFLDIQPSQRDALAAMLGPQAEFYPVVRARIAAIDTIPIDRETERRRRRDNLARTFNLTYREDLLPDEVLIAGRTLFRSDWPPEVVQVSVLERVRRLHPFQIGDRIGFRIQGVPLEAVVSSIRARTRDSLSPFFYFVFQEKDLAAAPHTLFAALQTPPDEIHALQNRVAGRFANISAIDVTATARVFGRILRRLSTIVRFFTTFAVAAGLLIIVSAVLATRAARVRETVYFKILGASRRFVARVFALENLLIGFFSGLLALAAAQAAAWRVCRQVLEIGYHPYPGIALALLAGTIALVMAVGMAAARGILNEKPEVFLRRQDQGM